MFRCCLRPKRYSRMTNEKPTDTRSFISSMNVYSSRVVSVVEAVSDYHGDEKHQDTLDFGRGDIIHVIEMKEDYFVGFLQTDPHKNLGRFPANLCKVHKSWLKEKWVESNPTVVSAQDMPTYNTRHIITEKSPTYAMSAPTYVNIII
ncbi:hypothetical protein K493DRAFT_375548 [Basidiobolus meristosporus CBS 931.73]|uniref:SH3 domain-containing protein n=1 Tax=Basidiobolus meristosporus CBS 931.73 TaxID=1314790 RepID=A0A1Y1Y5K5_9FUNG|nr:hypothetical protein K493DRAFT_375548 [Basidiobolus meristosporus CBS 931.73]|eukprot:ORX93258.1 hypothetical protein K493DRAFT_375548 [Basidiobolus meristosporus CBS 931.73]